MRNVFKTFKPDMVFHAAAYKHVPVMESNPSESILNNVLGTKVLVDLADEFRTKKFVMVSTDKAVNPTNIMGATKRIAEIYAQSMNHRSQTRFITTRFGNVLGSNGSVIPRFKKQIEKGQPITVTHPEVTRFFMTISEACQLVLEAGAMGKGGEIFIFDMGESIRIADLAKKMIQLSGLTLGKDIQIVYTGLRPGENCTKSCWRMKRIRCLRTIRKS
jgi:FlaA1/EpsC-like NDP-sugar epimerase